MNIFLEKTKPKHFIIFYFLIYLLIWLLHITGIKKGETDIFSTNSIQEFYGIVFVHSTLLLIFYRSNIPILITIAIVLIPDFIYISYLIIGIIEILMK